MWHYVFATHSLLLSLMQASIRTGCHIITLCKIANTIAIFDKMEAVFSPHASSHAPHHPFQRCRKNKAFLVLADVLNKVFIHFFSFRYSKLSQICFHFIAIHSFTPYKHRTARVFRASYTCFSPTLQTYMYALFFCDI